MLEKQPLFELVENRHVHKGMYILFNFDNVSYSNHLN